MRAAQNFDALNFREVGDGDTSAGAEHAVDEEADSRFEARVVAAGAESADANRGAQRGRLTGADTKARRELLEVEQVFDAGVFERFAADRGHRDRNVLDCRRTAGGGDDDFIRNVVVLRKSWAHRAHCRERDARKQNPTQLLLTSHKPSSQCQGTPSMGVRGKPSACRAGERVLPPRPTCPSCHCRLKRLHCQRDVIV